MKYLIAAAIFCASPALAQQPAKDRKDFLLEALQSQRDDGLAKLAFCYADGNTQIAKLQAEIAELKAAAEKKPEPPAAQ